MLTVEWSADALDDLDNITDYISEHNVLAAINLADDIFKAAENLCQMPYMGRVGRVFGTREFVVHPNYILVYQVKSTTLKIVSVLHGKRKYP